MSSGKKKLTIKYVPMQVSARAAALAQEFADSLSERLGIEVRPDVIISVAALSSLKTIDIVAKSKDSLGDGVIGMIPMVVEAIAASRARRSGRAAEPPSAGGEPCCGDVGMPCGGASGAGAVPVPVDVDRLQRLLASMMRGLESMPKTPEATRLASAIQEAVIDVLVQNVPKSEPAKPPPSGDEGAEVERPAAEPQA